MPIQRAAFKSVRKDKKRHARNLMIASELKTIEKRFRSFINAKDQKGITETAALFISKLAKAASKGIIHKNTASRKISRLMKGLKKLERGQ
jgi:small subunit ribosomal protein S20